MTRTQIPDAFAKPGPHLVRPQFMGPDDNAKLLNYALSEEDNFRDSTVTRGGGETAPDPEFRISSILQPSAEIHDLIRERAVSELAGVLDELQLKPFDPAYFEIEIVSHGNGAFFKTHIDTNVSGRKTAGVQGNGRAISMVYYFCSTPARFTGGELRVHSIAQSGEPGSYKDVVIENDLVIFFPSWIPHEVLPVQCADTKFSSHRFAVNCWIYK